MRSSNAAEKSTAVHQHGCKGWPLILACSMAH